LLAAGFASKQIGLQLGISPRAVEDHVSAMRQRAAAQSVTALITRCHAAGILIPAWPPRWSGSCCLRIGQYEAPRPCGIEPTECAPQRERMGQDHPEAIADEAPGPGPAPGRQPRPQLSAQRAGIAAASETIYETVGGIADVRHKLVGLAVSTDTRDAQLQCAALGEAGCGRIFEENTFTHKAARPGLAAALGRLGPGDTLCVRELDRLGRSVKDVLMIANDLHDRGIGLTILTGKLAGTYTPAGDGKLFFTVMAAFAELERNTRQKGIMAGLAAARANGRTGGRPTVMASDKLAAARARRASGESLPQIAKALGVSRATIYRHLNRQLP